MNFTELSQKAGEDATRCSQRGDNEGSFYARGIRDAYATAAVFGPLADVRRKLRERAESYSRDARKFADSPDIEDNRKWAAAYRVIASELRKTADQIGTE